MHTAQALTAASFDWLDTDTLAAPTDGLGELGSILSKFIKRNKNTLLKVGIGTAAAATFFIPVVGPVLGPLAITAAAGTLAPGSPPLPQTAAGSPIVLSTGSLPPTAPPAASAAGVLGIPRPALWALGGLAAVLLLRR